MSDDQLREQLGRLVRQLVREDDGLGPSVTPPLRAHLGETGLDNLAVIIEELQAWELPNLQLAIDAITARPGWSVEILGLAAHTRHYELGLGDLVHGIQWGGTLGPPEYVNAATGPATAIACLAFGILLITSPDGSIAGFVRRTHSHTGLSLSLQATSTVDGLAARFVTDLRELMERLDVYRGKVLTVTADPMSGNRIEFVERPMMAREELVLPAGLLETVERHVVGISRHRDDLVAAGRHLGRGLLLWGPPGTGKTHTVRYLIGAREDATVIVLSGGALGAAGGFVTMARRLAPSMLVLEDVDLVAQERAFGPFGSSPVLFELMNQMDGLPGDADLAFVLTTNRADALEPALAARPGRIDLAVEIPLPDAEGRRRLLDLYARGLELRLADPDALVTRMEGVTASFVKEVLRAAALQAAESGRAEVTDRDVGAILDGLLSDRAALTRVLLGGERSGAGDVPGPHAWMG